MPKKKATLGLLATAAPPTHIAATYRGHVRSAKTSVSLCPGYLRRTSGRVEAFTRVVLARFVTPLQQQKSFSSVFWVQTRTLLKLKAYYAGLCSKIGVFFCRLRCRKFVKKFLSACSLLCIAKEPALNTMHEKRKNICVTIIMPNHG